MLNLKELLLEMAVHSKCCGSVNHLRFILFASSNQRSEAQLGPAVDKVLNTGRRYIQNVLL